jgi:hypothetical protein
VYSITKSDFAFVEASYAHKAVPWEYFKSLFATAGKRLESVISSIPQYNILWTIIQLRWNLDFRFQCVLYESIHTIIYVIIPKYYLARGSNRYER